MQISTDNPVLPPIVDGATLFEHRSLQSIEFYEAAISTDETIVSNYWYLGLSYLLVGREDDARAAWFVPLADANQIEVDVYTDELLTILDREATSRSQVADLESAWLIRQHLWMLDPNRIDNILQTIVLANALDQLTIEQLIEWQIDELLETVSAGSIDDKLLEQTIAALIKDLHTELSLKIIKSCFN